MLALHDNLEFFIHITFLWEVLFVHSFLRSDVNLEGSNISLYVMGDTISEVKVNKT